MATPPNRSVEVSGAAPIPAQAQCAAGPKPAQVDARANNKNGRSSVEPPREHSYDDDSESIRMHHSRQRGPPLSWLWTAWGRPTGLNHWTASALCSGRLGEIAAPQVGRDKLEGRGQGSRTPGKECFGRHRCRRGEVYAQLMRSITSHRVSGLSRARESRTTTGRTLMELAFSDVVVRLLAAAAAGGLVGLNRDLAQKPIGVRTLGLVSLGAATAALAVIQVPGMAENADAMSRVVQGVVQGIMGGISFIGAGVILRNTATRTVDGLTTAATVWVSAALGIACALGAWITALIATTITLVLLFAGGWLERLPERRNTHQGGG
jgi:putative Mg2+ transporter-C (MgtC) family protein